MPATKVKAVRVVRVPKKAVAAAKQDAAPTPEPDRKTHNLQLLEQAAALLKKVDVRSIPKSLREDVRDIKDGLPLVVEQQREYIAGKVS